MLLPIYKSDMNTEDTDQKLLVSYLELLHDVKFTHIPNSTFTKSWGVKMRNKALGVRAGFPDLVIIIRNKFFCIEMKREKGGVLSPVQKEWINALKNANIPVHVCKGFDEAKKVVDSYYL